MTWLFDEPEGIGFERLPDDEKHNYALRQSQRTDKDKRWRHVWAAISWSHTKSPSYLPSVVMYTRGYDCSLGP